MYVCVCVFSSFYIISLSYHIDFKFFSHISVSISNQKVLPKGYKHNINNTIRNIGLSDIHPSITHLHKFQKDIINIQYFQLYQWHYASLLYYKDDRCRYKYSIKIQLLLRLLTNFKSLRLYSTQNNFFLSSFGPPLLQKD